MTKLDSAKQLLNQVAIELSDWKSGPQAGDGSEGFYELVEEHLTELDRSTTLFEIRTKLKRLRRVLVDSGPWNRDFLPSLEALEKATREPPS